jgi:hypothetical protein
MQLFQSRRIGHYRRQTLQHAERLESRALLAVDAFASLASNWQSAGLVGAATAPGFQIEVVFPDSSLTASQKQVFSQAAARWGEIIVGDLSDVTVGGDVIDDIRITAVGESIDGEYGTLGTGGPSWGNSPRPPAQGSMTFDTADLPRMEGDGTLFPVILHEMGHALGLGTMWSFRNLLGSGGYVGTNALREYRFLLNLPDATYIPTAGSGHWDETTFDTELMTPIAEFAGILQPISRMTVGSLEDLGYQVNYAAADPYPPSSGSVTVTVGDATVTEGNSGPTQATLTFTLSKAATSAVTLQYATVDGTATTANNDYGAAAGTITFAAGETQKTISLVVKGDTTAEGNETLTVALSNPVGATLVRTSATVTITNDDSTPPPPGLPTLSISDLTLTEGNSGNTSGVVTIKLSQAPAQTVTVKWAPKDGTATKADSDYSFPLTGGTLTFNLGGGTERQIDVVVTGDAKFEFNETFSVELSDPQGATIADAEGVITIENDDADIPVLSIADTSIAEGDVGQKTARVTVSLSKPSADPVSVMLRTEDGTAEAADGDYVPLAAGTIVSFSPGQISRVVEVPIVGDRTFEDDETFNVVLSDAQGTVIATESSTVTIQNDDRDPATLPRVTLLPAVAVETPNGRSFATFRLMISGELTVPVDLTYATQDGSASGRRDYRPARGALRILPGQTEALVSVAVVDDRLLEQDETFSLVVSAAPGGDTRVVPWTTPLSEQTSASVSAVILDDDSRFITVKSAAQTLSTGEAAAFTIALGRMAGFGDALPSVSGLEGLPASHLASMAQGIRFSARYSMSYEPAKRGGPRGARPTIQTGVAEFGYFGNGDSGLQSRSASDMDLATTQVPIAGTVTARLLSATNARVRQGVATLSARPVMSAAFAALSSSPRALRQRVR